MQKTYIFNPNTTFATLTTSPMQGKVVALALAHAVPAAATRIAPSASPKPTLPPRQPLPQPVIDPTKPRLQLSLDVHLESITVVSQRGHTSAQTPRQFTPEQLVEQIRKWVAQGLPFFACKNPAASVSCCTANW
jgi:hypothetical protein